MTRRKAKNIPVILYGKFSKFLKCNSDSGYGVSIFGRAYSDGSGTGCVTYGWADGDGCSYSDDGIFWRLEKLKAFT